MNTTEDRARRPHPAALRLRVTLETLATALANAQLDALLVCEAELASALTDVSDHGAHDRLATAQELATARLALTRCRRLGATLNDVSRLTLAAQGRDHGYGRQAAGRHVASMHSLEAKA